MQFKTVLERLILYSRRDKIIIPIEKEIENFFLKIDAHLIVKGSPYKIIS